MQEREHSKTLIAFFASLIPLIASFAQAGGPLLNCQSGQPYLWPDGGRNIPYHLDQGGLGIFTNAEAVLLVEESFQAWEDLSTSSVSFVHGGFLSVDVDITNFFEYLFSTEPGENPVVFDETGEIFDLLFGVGSGIAGFAGPVLLDPATCTILRSDVWLKGGPHRFDADLTRDITVHEIGHFVNLAHTQLNGHVIWDLGPSSPDTGLFPPPAPFAPVIETMGPGLTPPAGSMATPHADEVGIVSRLYPETGFLESAGAICGTVFAPNGTTRLTGFNVVARNVLDPYNDAVSAISGDFTEGTDQSDPVVGTYCLYGLTPGASYVVFVEQIIVPGGYSTPVAEAVPGPVEFYNGFDESADPTTDDPLDYDLVTPIAGVPLTGIDIVFNQWVPGAPLTVGDQGAVELYLPFSFELCGEKYDSVFVNGNGGLTFGSAPPWWLVFPYPFNVPDFLRGAPQIGFWTDFNVLAGGLVTFEEDPAFVKILYENVPEYPNVGANSFEITLFRSHRPSPFLLSYGDMTALNGITGFSCGGEDTTGFETETDLTSSFVLHDTHVLDSRGKTALFEEFTSSDNDLSGRRLFYVNGTSDFSDRFEPNDSIGMATKIKLPFDSWSEKLFTEISPAGGDVDYFEFKAKSGDVLTAEILAGALDTVMGLFQVVGHGPRKTGTLVAMDDDGGAGFLSKIVFEVPEGGSYVIAVTTWPDFDFDGVGGIGQGRYVLSLSK